MSLWRCASCGDLDKRHYIEKCMRCQGNMIPVEEETVIEEE